jgi:hypothetical protein
VEKFNYMVGITFILFLFMITSCSYVLESIQKVNCNTDKLTKLEIANCEMEARLLELKY